MTKYIFCTIEGALSWDVHSEGCQDIERGLSVSKTGRNIDRRGRKITRVYQDSYIVEAKTVKEAIQFEVEALNEDFGKGTWNSKFFHVKPCVKREEQ